MEVVMDVPNKGFLTVSGWRVVFLFVSFNRHLDPENAIAYPII
jgi:hypothetical protein